MQRSRIYECMCLLDNREVRKGWQPLKEAVTGLFTKRGAEVVSARRWEERRLAYPIRGQQRGTYLLAYVKADTQQLAGIRRDLQFNESVLRSLVLGCEEVPASAYEPEAEFDVNSIPADDTPPVREPVVRVEAEPPPAVDVEPRGAEEASPERDEAKTTGQEAEPR